MGLEYKGKAIYTPKAKAKEYSEWACNTHVGCNHNCTYCYLKKGRGAKILGGDVPVLKKCFNSNEHALQIFNKELVKNLEDLQKHGLFFSFTTDPCSYYGTLDNPFNFLSIAVGICSSYKVPVKILTKCGGSELVERISHAKMMEYWDKKLVAIGFTLTGRDELEPNASKNKDRIYAMSQLKNSGYKTFVSFEPMFSDWYVLDILRKYHKQIDLAKIGLESGAGKVKFMYEFIEDILAIEGMKTKIYFKDSVIKQANVIRKDLWGNAVERDYNLFK